MNDILQNAQDKYKKMLRDDDWLSMYFEFEKQLLSSDNDIYLEFHYEILSKREKEGLHQYIKACFAQRKNKKRVIEFLLKKYNNHIKDSLLKADIIEILGHLRAKEVLLLAKENITSSNPDIRYRCIIVLGWVGTLKTLPVLNERMLNDNDGQLRGYAATAMRQIWFNHSKTKEQITAFISNAILTETDEKALTGMIITIQDLYRKKLGLKESVYGDVSGNVQEAKEKTIIFLSKL